MTESPLTFKEFKQKSSDWPRQPMNEDLSGLNRSYMKFRSIYQSGRKFSSKEWIELISNLLDDIN